MVILAFKPVQKPEDWGSLTNTWNQGLMLSTT